MADFGQVTDRLACRMTAIESPSREGVAFARGALFAIPVSVIWWGGCLIAIWWAFR